MAIEGDFDKAFKSAFGETRRWKDGDILHAENVFISGAYVVTDDKSKVGSLGFHGPRELCVEYISAEAAKVWDTVGV